MSLNSEEKNTAYDKLTPQRKQLVDKVMENLEKGNLFWSQGWVSSGAPESAITGKKYREIRFGKRKSVSESERRAVLRDYRGNERLFGKGI